jgi:hypothetical protein
MQDFFTFKNTISVRKHSWTQYYLMYVVVLLRAVYVICTARKNEDVVDIFMKVQLASHV